MRYTAEQVDELFAQFEKCAQRQNANKSSAVKLRAAESDLLRVAEKVRDLLDGAVKGDRGLLVDVFGGNCQRFHRFRRVMDSVEFSAMHAKDQRWRHLSDAMETVEEILKQLGSFRPFQLEKKAAPEIRGYRGLRDRFLPGERVLMRPECEGCEADSFAVVPELPEGLVLDPCTGEISGTLRPGVEVPAQAYVVTARNEHGETALELRFSVAPPAPESLAYGEVPGDCYTSEAVHWAAEVSGGSPSQWSISPALPPALCLDAHTGSITGMPTDTAEAVEYTVTAANASGSVTAVLKFGVKPAPPVALLYPGAQEEYPFGGVIYLVPDVTLKTSAATKRPMSANWDRVRSKFLTSGAKWQSILAASLAAKAKMPKMSFSIDPPLPEGMSLAVKTGVIGGKAVSPSEETSYTVTCSNDGGKISTDLKFGIKLRAPASLQYRMTSTRFLVGQAVALSPEVQGLVSEWQVEPALPAGLHLDPDMGIVGGMPTEVVPEGSWTVTARNTEGETSATLTFAVQRAAPSSLEYPALAQEYPVLRSMAVQPTVEGQVDKYTVEPALPSGLELAPETGVISGTPSAPVDSAQYTVTAMNETGAVSACLTFAIKVMPPESLSYPGVDDVYNVGEAVDLEPQVEGGATNWTAEPALPEGLVLDAATGRILGAPLAPAGEESYVITATNEAGGTSVVLTFGITAPRPQGLCYPSASDDYVVGEEALLEPQLASGVCTTFSVEPELPDGLQLDPKTGIISGSPSAATKLQTYKVTAKNCSGSTSVDVAFMCSDPVDENSGVNQKFAALIEEITDIADLVSEPTKNDNLGDWMIWMVHRAWLNDPSLTDFNFSNKWMPAPHVEPRIAPKLMKAMEHNTHILSLQLANSNMMKPQGHELADALKHNTTLQILNIETNALDSDGLRHIAAAINENPDSSLEQLRFNNQKSLGAYFGRPVEQAFAEMLEKNVRITKIGFSCNDAHWRLMIDRAILRNTDAARRRRKGSVLAAAEQVVAQEKPLSRLMLSGLPDKAMWEVFEDNDERAALIRGYVADAKRLPTKEQIQSFARGQGKPIPYSAVATVFKDFRAKLVGAAVGSQVVVYDVYGADFPGCLRAWAEKNERWSLDIWPAGDTRYNFTADKQPIIEVSEEFAAWLNPSV